MSGIPSHVGDIGTVFELELVDQDRQVVDISAADIMEIILQDPDGVAVTKTAERTTTGLDGKFRYVTLAGDLDKFGVWYWQGHVVIGTSEFKTNILRFKVEPNL